MTERLVVPGQRLGRLPTPEAVREQNFKLARYLPTLPEPPETLDLTTGGRDKTGIGEWPMYANDRLGDCTCAALGHMIEVWTEQVDGAPHLVTDADVIDLYNLVNGGRDAGADMQNVLNCFRHQGLAGDKILGYAEVDVADLKAVKTAAWLFGGVYFGANLAIANQGQAEWDAAEGPEGTPGSWGGHAINLVAYDDRGGALITWGAPKRFTWAWWSKYVDEAYVAIPHDYDRLAGKALANGFNEDQLRADLETLGNAQYDPE